jgi:SHS2 domain-containing protein
VAEAVAAAVDTFARVSGEPQRLHRARLEAADDAELLVAALDELVFVLETAGAVPVRIALRPVPGGADLELGLVDVGHARQVGAVPKGVSRHELRVEHGPHGWWCTAILDV